jgi:hypothetical protein
MFEKYFTNSKHNQSQIKRENTKEIIDIDPNTVNYKSSTVESMPTDIMSPLLLPLVAGFIMRKLFPDKEDDKKENSKNMNRLSINEYEIKEKYSSQYYLRGIARPNI